MHLTIASFHARFTAPDADALLAALRKLRRLADVQQVFDPTGWPVWDAPGVRQEERSPSRA